jgi:small subunit ribosomal protein S6
LAYKVKKNRFGNYLNIYHTCENEQLSSLEAKYKLYDAIIKFMVLRLDDKELERAIKQDVPTEDGGDADIAVDESDDVSVEQEEAENS